MTQITDEHKDRIVEALTDLGGVAHHFDLVGTAAPEHEEDAEQLAEAARQMTGTVLSTRGGITIFKTPQ